MRRFFFHVLALSPLVFSLILHSVACQMHMAATSHRPDGWHVSRAYCSVAGAPARWLMSQ